jgi:hypothetical protein
MFARAHWNITGARQANGQSLRPRLGMTLTFKPSAEATLAGIPAHIIHVWPRFQSGDYLVTLEFAQPVKLRNVFVRQIDAFISELDQPSAVARPTLH